MDNEFVISVAGKELRLSTFEVCELLENLIRTTQISIENKVLFCNSIIAGLSAEEQNDLLSELKDAPDGCCCDSVTIRPAKEINF